MKSITISGFQVFAEETTIPLEKLTFLYGPNSAGKSAVEDALLMISEICKAYQREHPYEYDPFIQGSHNSLPIKLFQKNWRRVSDNPLEIQNWLEISFTTDGDKTIEFSYGSSDAKYWFNYLDPYYFNSDVFRDTQIKISDQILTILKDDEYVAINFLHPSLAINIPQEILDACKKYPDIFSNENGLVTIRENVRPNNLTQGVSFSSAIHNSDRWVAHSDGKKTYLPPTAPDLIKAYKIFGEIFDELQYEHIACESLQLSMVPASRKTPQPEELVFLLPKEDIKNDFFKFHLANQGLPEFSCLAKSFINDNLSSQSLNFSKRDSFNFSGYDDLYKNVNHSLSDDLFNERGYHLGFDYRTIRDSLEEDEAYIVRIFLIDAQGRTYDFTEVGSGLGYLLPVLVSIWRSASEDDKEQSSIGSSYTSLPNTGVLFIQQPELHLHPALQANLGDVFIESASNSNCSNFIIETHSENILLRILKRIRQTKLELISSDYAVKPENVSVLYFNPNPDGTSSVKRLRISESGDFLDRWPRGFFTERDSEFFDDGNPFA